MSISLLLNEPFYTGSEVSAETPYPYSVALGGHGYFIDTKKLARTTIEIIRQGFDPTGEPGEQSLSSEGIWKRWADDWSFGCGQLYYDTKESDRRRFNTSEGINPWKVKGAIELLEECALKKSSVNTNLQVLTAAGYLYYADGATLNFTLDATPASPAWTAVTMGGTIRSLTSDGAYVYAAIGTAVERTAIGTATKTVFSTGPAVVVAFANGRLLAASGPTLYEINGAGVATALWTHFNVNAVIVSITGTPSGIFVGINNGEYGEFMFVGFNATTGGLATPLPAGALNRGESIYAMRYYQGIVVLGTSRGLRESQVVQDRGLAPGPVIEHTSPVRCLDVEGEFLWWGFTNGGSGDTGLARSNLARETVANGVHAYCSDLMAPNVTGEVTGVVRFKGQTYFTVSGSGIWGPDGNLVPSGTIDSGWIRFGTVERLVLHNVDLYHEPLNGAVEVSVIDEAGVEITVGENTVQGSVAPANLLSGRQVDSEAFRVVLTLKRASNPALGPHVLRWILRAIVAPLQVERIIVPIILHSVVRDANSDGQDFYFDVNREFAYLKGLESSRQVVQFQMAFESIPCVVRQVQVPEGDFRGFGDLRAYLDQTVTVHLMTLEV